MRGYRKVIAVKRLLAVDTGMIVLLSRTVVPDRRTRVAWQTKERDIEAGAGRVKATADGWMVYRDAEADDCRGARLRMAFVVDPEGHRIESIERGTKNVGDVIQ